MLASTSKVRKCTRIGGRSGKEIAGLYDLEDTIGEGHFAVVKCARHVFTGERVAVKVINKAKFDSSNRVQSLQEVRLMKLVQHPNVVRLYEVIDTASKLYLILELADGGDLYDYIMKHEQGLSEALAKKYFRQMVNAIQYCHKLHVVHRDLKPENAVFFEKLEMVKLTDFGFSNNFNPGQSLKTSCGSLAYSAPEILLGDAYDAPAVDIWSLGVILYMLVCGAAPFQEANDSETLTMIMDCKYTFPKHISSQCKKLISSMLQRNPMNRACLEDIIRHPWLDEVRNADSVPEWEQLPLVSREHLTEEEHAQIIAKMVNGAIGTREEIIEALDRDDYNHITATYFLLAERKLRAQRQDLVKSTQPKKPSDVTSSFPSVPTRNIVEASRKTVTTSKSTVESLLSPEDNNKKPVSYRIRQFSIVEEEEEEELDEAVLPLEDSEDKMPSRGLSHHSSTSSLGSVVAGSLGLLGLEKDKALLLGVGGSGDESPAPFPLSSQIGTGTLSRQGSLRRSSGSSPCSERKSGPGSPESPPPDTSQGSSPAKYPPKLRKTPQQSSSALNQIFEEDFEASDAFPKGGSLLLRRRFDQRRVKSRTQSCSSSEASDDDSEKKRLSDKKWSPPKDDDDDDHSDGNHHHPGGGASGGSGSSSSFHPEERSGSSRQRSSEDGKSGDNNTSNTSTGSKSEENNRRSRHVSRLRQSHSLNRISELHEVDFTNPPERKSPPRTTHDSEEGNMRVNMRILEMKLNKIQEESSGMQLSNPQGNSNSPSPHTQNELNRKKSITKVDDILELSTSLLAKRPLIRAHSCSSLLSLRERALLRKKLLGSTLLDMLGKDMGGGRTLEQPPLKTALLHTSLHPFLSLPNASRCCSLC